MRPIDADELEERFSIECVGECGCCPHNKYEEKVRNESRYFFQETYTVEYCDLIRNAPTISIDSFDPEYIRSCVEQAKRQMREEKKNDED